MDLPQKVIDSFGNAGRILDTMNRESGKVDPKLWSLYSLKLSLGEQALECILFGLSRPIAPTRQDAEALVSQWERRDKACCFRGSIHDLMSQKQTIAIALSYRHDDRNNFNRKGGGIVSKMVDEDQEEFIQSVVGLGLFYGTSSILVWCDQILSTRLEKEKMGLYAWHNIGLLPYIGLPVLTMSNRIPEEELEKRIWIKAERSLGFRGGGLLPVNDAKLGIILTVKHPGTASDVLRTIALFILSGYWPPDKGYWENAYNEMKKWALAVTCQTNNLSSLEIQKVTQPVDNLEILLNFHALVVIPRKFDDLLRSPRATEHIERPSDTEDKYFFLRQTAWNLSLEEVWNTDGTRVSHYHALGFQYKFSWWMERHSEAICGCFALQDDACFVLAVRYGKGYTVYRRRIHPSRYRHKEPNAGAETKRIIEETAQMFKINVDTDSEWYLRYFCDPWTMDDLNLDMEVKKYMDNVKKYTYPSYSLVDSLVPYTLIGVSRSLYRAFTALRGRNKADDAIPREFISHFDTWNSYVRTKYKSWISVRDTHLGPVWLEGYNEDCVSFGFLDFLTRRMFGDERYISDRTIKLPAKWQAVQEIRRALESAGDDIKLIENELFGGISETNCEKEIRTSEVAMLMVCGGFTSDFNKEAVRSFLKRAAELRGYWSTTIRCRSGEIQIVFQNGRGDVRIMARKTNIENFNAIGVVTLEDSDSVAMNTDVLRERPEIYRKDNYWNANIECFATKAQVSCCFRHSIRDFRGKIVSLVDMTSGIGLDTDLCSVHDESGRPLDEVIENMRSKGFSVPKEVLDDLEGLESLYKGGAGGAEIQEIVHKNRAQRQKELEELDNVHEQLYVKAQEIFANANRKLREFREGQQRDQRDGGEEGTT